MRPGVEHLANEGIGVIGRFLEQGVVRERNRVAVFDERGGFAPFRGCDQIARTDLIVLTTGPSWKAPSSTFRHRLSWHGEKEHRQHD
jgi:hypothetical protein